MARVLARSTLVRLLHRNLNDMRRVGGTWGKTRLCTSPAPASKTRSTRRSPDVRHTLRLVRRARPSAPGGAKRKAHSTAGVRLVRRAVAPLRLIGLHVAHGRAPAPRQLQRQRHSVLPCFFSGDLITTGRSGNLRLLYDGTVNLRNLRLHGVQLPLQSGVRRLLRPRCSRPTPKVVHCDACL